MTAPPERDELPERADEDVRIVVDPVGRQITGSIPVDCRAETIYAVWSEVEAWSRWDPDTRSARLDGPFESGSSGRLTPRKGFAVRMRLTEAVANERFTVVCPVLGNRMSFEHRLTRSESRLVVTHSVRFAGWLSGMLFRQVGRDVERGLPLTLTRLRAHCLARERLLAR